MKNLLLRKILRSMWENRRSYLACVSVIAIGVMIFIALSNVSDNMGLAVNSFYEECRLADVFAKVKLMPRSGAETLSSIEGIDIVAPRLVMDVRVNNERSDKSVILRLIGVIPEQGNILNDYVFTGSPVSDIQDILVAPDFFAAYNYAIGDTIEVIINGSLTSFSICGTVQSPEYVYTIPNAKSLYPDPEAFNIGFVHNSALEKASGNTGYVNDISFTLQNGYRFKDLNEELSNALQPFGLLSLYERKDQISFSMTDMEISSISTVSKVMPLLFLTIAAVVLYIMLRRIVEQERVTIGTLKAFGYADNTILLYYMLYGSITGLIGGLCGGIMGLPMAGFYFTMMLMFFNLPGIAVQLSASYIFSGILLAVALSTISALLGVRSILGLRPAESMRPAAPPQVKESYLDRSRALKSILTSRGMMSLRYLTRNKMRSAFILMSITLCCAMMTVIFSFNLMIDQMIFAQMERAQVYDFQASLKNPAEYTDAINSVSTLDGVLEAEALYEVAATLINSNIRKGMIITGVPQYSQLYYIIDDDYRRYPPPENGLLLSQGLADKLGVSKGDILEIESPLLNESVPVAVVQIISQPFGNGCYMELEALARLLGSAPLATTVVFNIDEAYIGSIKTELLTAKNVEVIEDKARMLQAYQDLMGPFSYVYYILGLMAIFIGFAVIYNISKVSLSERSRELATMRVLGLSIAETNEVITFEHWLLCFLAILVGIPLAFGLRQVLSGIFDSDIFSIPTTTPLSAILLSALGSMASVWLANRSVAKTIAQFDLVEVLKERE